MYESFFGLVRRPFVATPAADRYFPGSSIEAARSSLARCIERAAGAGLVVGPSGAGKTMLLDVLAQQFRPRMQVALLSGGHLPTRRALLKVILFELGLPYRRSEEGDLRLSLIDFLTRGDKCPGGLLLLVDEAHTLPLRLLEEVRLITNLARGGRPCVQLVLAGAPALEDRLASPKMESLSQRIAARCYLEALSKPETRDYVRYQIAAAGGAVERIFAADALDAIYRATDGVPRLLNQVCDHALMLAFADDLRLLDASAVERAWADLQQLPAPWVAKFTAPAEASTAQRDILEFGDLADDAQVDGAPLGVDETAAAAYAELPTTMPLSAPVSPTYEEAHEEFAAEWEMVSAASTFHGGGEALDSSLDAPPLERQPAEELDRSGLRISRSEPGERPAGDMLHEEVVVDLYAELDAQREQRAGRSAMASAWTHSSEPDWLAGLPKVKENSPEETLSLAEALLLREMATDDPPHADSLAPGEYTGGRAVDDAAIPPRDANTDPLPALERHSTADKFVLPFDEAESGKAPLLPPSPRQADVTGTEEESASSFGELVGETIPLAVPDVLRDAGELSFGDADDGDLIVVEDDPPTVEPAPEPSTPVAETASVVRPHEFRQLFAKLRRG